jgi:hypothetical protein
MTDILNYAKFHSLPLLNSPSLENQHLIIQYLLSNYGFRISEILNIKKESLLKNFKITIQISKTHENIIIRDKYIWLWLSDFFKNANSSQFTTKYHLYFRWQRLHFPNDKTSPRPKNRAITHYYRVKMANELKDETNNENLIKNALNHKSKRTQKYYLKKYKS